MLPTFKLDSAKFSRAVRELAALPGKKPIQAIMRSAAGQVVKRVVSVTPPAKGTANAAAKKAGETTIKNDLAKILAVAAARIKRKLESPAAVHTRSRDARTGRVNPRARKVRTAVARAEFASLQKQLVSQVGTLAAGWNAAAAALGVKLPVWITRHGTRHGIIKIAVSRTGIRITIGNAVAFVDNIKDLERRLQWAVDVVAKNIIEKQVPAAVKSIGRRAGFKKR